MSMAFDALGTVKLVLIKHLLRQQIEADLHQLRQTTLRLQRCYVACLDAIHAKLLASISEHKRELRRYGIKIIAQKKSEFDFQIAYLERGYQVRHCFLLATLRAESEVLFQQYLQGGTYEPSS
jgi:hypothetical protein